MSRKDYVAVAKAVRKVWAYHVEWQHPQVSEAVRDLASELADVFQADNSRFDRAKFLDACFSK